MRALAEGHWSNCRAFWPAGEDLEMDEALTELRNILDTLAEVMRADHPADWALYQMVWSDTDVKDYDAEMAELFPEGYHDFAKDEEEGATDVAEGDTEEVTEVVEVEKGTTTELADKAEEDQVHSPSTSD